MLDVCLLGTSGMMPLPKRALTACMTRLNGSSLLIDCGEGTQVAIREKGWSVHPIDTICITHFHGDHVSGLPGLLLSIGNAERTKPLTIIGPKGLRKVVKALTIIAPGLPFEIEYIELDEKYQKIALNGYVIEAFQVNHNITCYGYNVIVTRGGKFLPEKAKENGVPLALWSVLQKGKTVEKDGIAYTPDMVLGEKRKGIKLTYCTDTRPTQSIITHANEADLFICEGMYGEKNMDDKAVLHKHMTFFDAAELAKKSRVKELWLTHYSPSLVRPEDYIKNIKDIFDNVKAGKDRMSKEIEFEPDESLVSVVHSKSE